MRIKCGNPATKALMFKGTMIRFNSKSEAEIDDELGRELVRTYDAITEVKAKTSTKKEKKDDE